VVLQGLLDELLQFAELGVQVPAPVLLVCAGCLGHQDVHIGQQHPAWQVKFRLFFEFCLKKVNSATPPST
jgi:hypothetical protein